MYKVLILDDDKFRHEEFKRRFENKTDLQVYHVENSTDAISLLNEHDFNLIFLDHDLGGLSFQPSESPNTGFEVTKYISINPEVLKKTYYIIIHSLNPVGAKKMENQLKPIFINTHRIPRVWIKDVFEKVVNI